MGMESSRYHGTRSRARDGSKERQAGSMRARGMRVEEKKKAKVAATSGFSSRPGSRKEFMKGKSFPSTVRPPHGALRRRFP